MLDWLRDNGYVLSAAVNFGMLLVWAVYAVLFYNNYKMRRRPRLIIDYTENHEGEPECLLINMSMENMHIRLIGVAAPSGRTRPLKADKQVSTADSSPRSVESVLRQGPLNPGGFIVVGVFREIVAVAAGDGIDHEEGEWTDHRLELRVVADVSSEDRVVGGARKFVVRERHENIAVSAESIHTDQMRSRGERKQAAQWLVEAGDTEPL